MTAFKEVVYRSIAPKYEFHFLVGDIGGTNSNFGIFATMNGKTHMLFSLHTKSQEITDFTKVIQDLLAYVKQKYEVTLNTACFAVAGVPSQDRTHCKPTNLNFVLDTRQLVKNTTLKCAFLTNDFEVIGYGISEIDPKDVVLINQVQPRKEANKAILGAGTGLGKCIMFWNKQADRYVPVASEGGHADGVFLTEQEIELSHFIQKKEGSACPISWEEVLSGNGIMRLYAFFMEQFQIKESDNHNILKPDDIFKNRTLDKYAAFTAQLYTTFYARCAKNFSLDALALGGIYIAGGIASHNLDLFKQAAFLEEFISCGKHKELLQQIPIYIITDYNVSLYGAAAYVLLEGLCKV